MTGSLYKALGGASLRRRGCDRRDAQGQGAAAGARGSHVRGPLPPSRVGAQRRRLVRAGALARWGLASTRQLWCLLLSLMFPAQPTVSIPTREFHWTPV